MQPAPGLFSGPDGEFVVFRHANEPAAEPDTPEPPRRKLTDPPPP
jgi:hypothetical protein